MASAATFAAVSVASATVTFTLATPINGDVPPASPPVATFTTIGTNEVQVKMTDNIASSYIPYWLFDTTSASTLTFNYVSGPEATSVAQGTTDGAPQIKAGDFNILFTFPTPNMGRLSTGLTSVYDITGTGITAGSFKGMSTDGYYGAAEIRFGDSKSGSVGTMNVVPEPCSLPVLGLGAAAFIRRRRRS